jgi:hypothetical protein
MINLADLASIDPVKIIVGTSSQTYPWMDTTPEEELTY